MRCNLGQVESIMPSNGTKKNCIVRSNGGYLWHDCSISRLCSVPAKMLSNSNKTQFIFKLDWSMHNISPFNIIKDMNLVGTMNETTIDTRQTRWDEAIINECVHIKRLLPRRSSVVFRKIVRRLNIETVQIERNKWTASERLLIQNVRQWEFNQFCVTHFFLRRMPLMITAFSTLLVLFGLQNTEYHINWYLIAHKIGL